MDNDADWRKRNGVAPKAQEVRMGARKLSGEEVKKLLSRLKGWTVVNEKLHCEYE
jgi:hypothetical protein